MQHGRRRYKNPPIARGNLFVIFRFKPTWAFCLRTSTRSR